MLTSPRVAQTTLRPFGFFAKVILSALFSFLFLVLGAPPSGFEGGSFLAVSLPNVAAGLFRRFRMALPRC